MDKAVIAALSIIAGSLILISPTAIENYREYKYKNNPAYCEKGSDCRFSCKDYIGCFRPAENIYQPNETCGEDISCQGEKLPE